MIRHDPDHLPPAATSEPDLPTFGEQTVETLRTVHLLITGRIDGRKYRVDADSHSYRLNDAQHTFLLELLYARATDPNGALYHSRSLAADGDEFAARQLASRLRRELGSIGRTIIETIRRGYRLSACVAEVTVDSTVYSIPFLDPRIATRLKRAFGGDGVVTDALK